jgi:CDP-diglyceride synthetase
MAESKRFLPALILLASAAVLLMAPFEFFTISVCTLLMQAWREWSQMTRHRLPTSWLGNTRVLAGTLYIFIAFMALLLCACVHRASLWVLLAIPILNDTGAYFVGRWLRGPKLAPRISPGKTWSGACGGLVIAVAGAAFLDDFCQHHLWAIPELILLSAASQIGDLLESACKRFYGVKDSGTLIPGHGGLLDRLDSHMAVWITASILGH